MSKLKHSISSARCAYESTRYQGSLADELGIRQPRQTGRNGRRVWRWAALAALITVGVYLFRADNSTSTKSPSTPLQVAKQTSPESTREREIVPTVPAIPDNAATGDDATLADATADDATTGEATASAAADTTATVPDSFQFSAPSTSVSFSNITGWPSVSASIPALGGLPSLESSNSENTGSTTTQESAS